MAAGAMIGAQAGAGAGGGQSQASPGQSAPSANPPVEEFRPLAEAVKMLGQKFPEGAEDAASIMKAIQSWMTKVAGNSQRTQEAKAPPVA